MLRAAKLSRLARWLAASGLLCLCAGGMAAAEPAPRLRIGVDGRKDGLLSTIDEKGGSVGFIRDLLEEMGRAGGIEFELVPDYWSGLTDKFQTGQLDVLASVTNTAERRATMDFSITHATMHGVGYYRSDRPAVRRTADLARKKIGVLGGTVEHGNAVKHGGWGGSVLSYPKLEALFQAVATGECDVMLSTRRLPEKVVKNFGLRHEFIDDIVHEFRFAVHKGDSATLARLNDALATLRQNGTFQRIYTQWIGPIEPRQLRLADVKPYFLPAAVVLFGIVFIIVWQRRMLAQRATQAAVLRETEERYRGLVDSAFDGSVIYQDGVIRTVNAAYAKMFGYEVTELIGRPILDLSPPEEREKIGATVGAGEESPDEAIRVRKDGGRIRVETSGKACTYEGKPARIAAVRDITARKAAQEALRESELRYSIVVEQTGQMVYDLDVKSGVNLWFGEAAVRAITGYTLAEFQAVTLKGWSELIHPEDRAVAQVEFDRCCAAGERYDAVYRVRRQDGTYRTLQDFGVVLRDAAGRVVRILGAMADVTERVEAEEAIRRLNADLEQRVCERTAELAARVAEVEKLNREQHDLMLSLKTSEQAADRAASRLQEANANLLAANQELEAFSYSVSHDLRAPLRNITGFIELLAKRAGGQIDGESKRFAATVIAEAARMGMLIDDLLTFSRIGRTEMKLQSVYLDELVAEVREELKADIGERLIEWRLAPLPPVRGDRALLRQVIVNLLSNAVKFTRLRPKAEIEVGVSATRAVESTFTSFVRDNGAGFNPKYVEKLFGVFQRLHNQKDFEGTGIGLANVKRIINRHGGRVWAECGTNQGATFYFTLKPAKES